MKRRDREDLEAEFGMDAIALEEEIIRLEGILAEAEAGMTREYACHSPNGKGHQKLQIMDHGDEAWDIEFAEKFAWIYLEQSVTGGYHADAEASAVWRWVSPWKYMEGYPKTREQVEQRLKEQEEKS
jgi:hypothetical protein